MKSKYTAAIIGEKYAEYAKHLETYGYKVFLLPENDELENAVSSHADLSLFIIRKTLFVSESFYERNKALIDKICEFSSLALITTETGPFSPYPSDCIFCALNCDDRFIIANRKTVSKAVLKFCETEQIEIYHSAQGYTKCTSLYFGECLISADSSSLSAAQKSGLTTLEISDGDISLPGYDYGFIGGCSGCDGQNLYFCGNIDNHRDSERIKAFAANNGYAVISLSDGKLLDIGSILFI